MNESPELPNNRRKLWIFIVCIIVYIVCCLGILYALNVGGVRLLFVCMIYISGAFLGWILFLLYQKDSLTFSHIIVSWLIVNGTALLWAVMYLADTGAKDIAETLGRYIVTELLGTVGGSLTKSMVENLSKNNSWPDKKEKDFIKSSNRDL